MTDRIVAIEPPAAVWGIADADGGGNTLEMFAFRRGGPDGPPRARIEIEHTHDAPSTSVRLDRDRAMQVVSWLERFLEATK